MTYLSHLECSACGRRHEAEVLQSVCSACRSPLLPRYDLEAIRDRGVAFRGRGVWRYAPVLPCGEAGPRLSLGEGGTPVLELPRLAREVGVKRLLLKDEASNPTGTFKARGMAVAVPRAVELGAKRLALPSAGNAGEAAAAYAARAGLPITVAVPRDTPAVNIAGARTHGAEVLLVDGLISDCGKLVAEKAAEEGWFDLATFREPYRVEGKKTMGYELREDLGDAMPDVLLYPTGGGTGLVGISKAFDELDALGMAPARRPRMVAVQSEGCAPVVEAFAKKREATTFFEGARTLASGLRVPAPLAGPLILKVVRESGGTAVAVPDDAILAARRDLAAREGVAACLEGAATLAGLRRLVASGAVRRDESALLLNTGAGAKSPL